MKSMLTGKTVLLAVTGGIAAYKAANLASMLVKSNCNLIVMMTENATKFIHPITFETLTGNKCLVDTFDRNFQHSVEHVAVAQQADLALVAPASANCIAKLAHGLADDMLTTTLLACTCKKLVAPAMNTNMYLNPIVQDNIRTLEHYGFLVISPDVGYLACKATGIGKLPKEETLLAYVTRELAFEKDMEGLHVLVTAGPTREAIDPVRFLSNHSTGTMGMALARICMLRGAKTTLVAGPVAGTLPEFVRHIPVTSAAEMAQAVKEHYLNQDIIIKAAAVADYTPRFPMEQKMKKKEGELTLELKRTEDILAYLGEHKQNGQYLVGFAMETEHLLENARSKRIAKQADMIVANSLREPGAGFGAGTNVVTMITAREEIALPVMSKERAACEIVDQILRERA